MTTFNALRNSPARPGDLVAVQGIGGLGHLGIQLCAAWAFAWRRSPAARRKRRSPRSWGRIIISIARPRTPWPSSWRLGGARVILTTVSSSNAMSLLVGGLAPRGVMIVAGAGSDPIEVNPSDLLFGLRSIQGTLTGSAIDNEETLAFSVLQGIRPTIETVPLEAAAEAYQKMIRNEARFRMVLLTGP